MLKLRRNLFVLCLFERIPGNMLCYCTMSTNKRNYRTVFTATSALAGYVLASHSDGLQSSWEAEVAAIQKDDAFSLPDCLALKQRRPS